MSASALWPRLLLDGADTPLRPSLAAAGLSATEQALGVQYSRCVTQDTYVYWDSVSDSLFSPSIFPRRC